MSKAKSKTIEDLEAELAEKKIQLKNEQVANEFNQTIEKVHDRVAVALKDWVEQNEQKIVEDTLKTLNDAKISIISHMIGLTHTWGKWEVDHCNVRTSTIITMIKAKVGPAVDDWLRENLKVPALSNVQIAAIHTEYKKAYLAQVNEAIRERAARDAREFVDNQILPYRMKMEFGERKIDMKF